MNEQGLNKKLAEWAGFTHVVIHQHILIGRHATEKYLVNIPYFTQSLDACFKWLVPKLDESSLNCRIQQQEGIISACIYDGVHNTNYIFNKNPALALCLAIEKLIDGENK